jgi:pectate lyase
VYRKKNVIIRNLNIQKVLAENGDGIGLQAATNVWIDHCEISSDRAHDKDFYDGLLDITHASDFVTVSNTYFHDHWKASLVGHSDRNGPEDTGHLRVTYHNNYWHNVNSRMPSLRFGTGHIYNSYFESCNDGINTRKGAEVLVESNVFVGVPKPLYSTDAGYAVAKGNDFGNGTNMALQGNITNIPYKYTLIDATGIKAAVVSTAGATLRF